MKFKEEKAGFDFTGSRHLYLFHFSLQDFQLTRLLKECWIQSVKFL